MEFVLIWIVKDPLYILHIYFLWSRTIHIWLPVPFMCHLNLCKGKPYTSLPELK